MLIASHLAAPLQAGSGNLSGTATGYPGRAWPGAASQIRTVPSLPPVVSRWLFGEICQRPTGHRTPMVAPMAPLKTPLAAKRA